MSDMRRLLESMDKIAEQGKGVPRRPMELMGLEMGGGGGGGSISAGIAKVKPPVTANPKSSTTAPQTSATAPAAKPAYNAAKDSQAASAATPKSTTAKPAAPKTTSTAPAAKPAAPKTTSTAPAAKPAYNAAKDSQAASAAPSDVPTAQPKSAGVDSAQQWLSDMQRQIRADTRPPGIDTAVQNVQGALASVKQIPSNLARFAKDPVQYVKDTPAPTPDQMMGAFGAGAAGTLARIPSAVKAVKPGTPPAVWRNPVTGQASTAPGRTAPQPLPTGVTPSTAGAGRSGQGGPTAAELAAYKAPVTTPKPAATAPTTPATAKPTTTDAIPTVTKPKIERRPGETTADAIKRAQSEKGVTPKPEAPKPEAPKPAASDKPAVWRDPRTGETSSTPPGAGRPVAPKPEASKPTATTPAPATTPVKPLIQRLPDETPAQAVARVQATTPKPTATTPAPTAVKPAPATGPVNPNVKPGGSKEAQAYQAQRQAQRQAQQQPKPTSTTPDTATTPVKKPITRPTKTDKDSDSVGKTRPGGERDTLGRKEPSFDKTDIGPIGSARPGRIGANGLRRPSGEPKPTSLRKPAAAAAAVAASLYPSELGKSDLPTPVGSAGSAGTNGQPQVGGTPSPVNIELPTVGPQGSDSPFYVVPPESTPKPSDTAAPAPSVTTTPQSAASSGSGTGSGTGTSAGPGTGSSSQPGSGTGTGSDEDSIETKLRKNKYINETVIEKLLNDFTKFIESSTKNKSKAK